ncbi:hypothetical protein EYY99_07155 [Hafnia alvei]|uniref:hypothetical protein n=1 Tax=Hafnia alvei TaxID=569 RepID=UPI0010332A53|nr:hypothetical protein [Hafnia alvei]MDU3155219.1 hypothetical protein [Hafnia alvei]QBJ35191.1 hypothetical protein EYZ02_20945 [Hafnia alvei]TBL45627.1 hypothetical protein EYY99_07155 [Hafnia alvei]
MSGVIFRPPVSMSNPMKPLASASDESPVARGLSTRALFTAPFARPVSERTSCTPSTCHQHPCWWL